MTHPTEIDPTALAQSVVALPLRSGSERGDGIGRTMKVEQESGKAMTFTMFASNALDEAHLARVKVLLAERLVLDVELDRHGDDHIIHAFDDAEWSGLLLRALIFDEDAARAPRPDH